MFLNSRKFNVWLVSFLVVLVIYFIYNRFSRTPSMGGKGVVGPAVDVYDYNGGVGMVGGVGVGMVKNVHYTTLNAQKQVEREFGFEELLHQDGNDWEIKKPYITIYRRNFKCTINGEKAKVTVEISGGRVTPTNGILMGNVTIRILPQPKQGFGEAVIYLDDITFVGEKSLFFTDGAVELVSNDVRLLGTGLEIVYNGDAERLELLKIKNLQNLHIRRWSKGTALSTESPRQKGAEDTGHNEAEKGTGGSKQRYRCSLDKNVVIETLKERLMADVVSVSDISGSGSEAKDSDAQQQTEEGKTAAALNRASGGEQDKSLTAVEQAGDVAIRCDGGIIITPMDAAEKDKAVKARQPVTGTKEITAGAARDGKTIFCGETIDYSAATGRAVATGPSQIIFDVNDKSAGAPGKPATVTITAQRQAMFEPASNQVMFEGSCKCTGSESQGDATRQYVIMADKLEVGLTQANRAEGSASSLNVQRVIATSDVHLATTKKAGERMLEGVELKCAKMDYDVNSHGFSATGPGLIKMDNSQTDEPQKGLGRFSLRRKCYAFLRSFDSLKFDGVNNRLAADSKDGSLLMDYLPLVESGGTEKVAVTASHVEAELSETAQKRTELIGLTARGAVTYEDKDTQVVGSEFIYDTNGGEIVMRGDRTRPCLFNGAVLDSVRRDLNTGKWTTHIKGPGTGVIR